MKQFEIPLHFEPREFQVDFINSMISSKFRFAICVWHRRCGKDYAALFIMVYKALQKVGLYFYIYPTFTQAKRCMWNAIDNDGNKFMDLIPPQIIKSKNSVELKIELVNGSIIQLIGSSNYDNTIVGTNACGMVFSEFAVSAANKDAWERARPIIAMNKGWIIVNSTPRGKNYLYELWNIALTDPDWFTSFLTVNDTGLLTDEEIEKEKLYMSADRVQQEYFCSWDYGARGSYYTDEITKMMLEERITTVLYDSRYPVYTSWDIGTADATAIIYFQVDKAGDIKIIDCHTDNNKSLTHYAHVLRSKGYLYAKSFFPHDMRQREFTTAVTRFKQAQDLQLRPEIVDNIPVQDGIEAVKVTLNKTWIDEKNCSRLIQSLENYRSDWSDLLQDYTGVPVHDKYSHFADAMRYLAVANKSQFKTISQEERTKLYMNAKFQKPSSLGYPWDDKTYRN